VQPPNSTPHADARERRALHRLGGARRLLGTLGLIMSWRPPFHHLKHPKPRPRIKEPRDYFKASHWPTMPKAFLAVAVSRLATEEQLASGPVRARYRAKRLRAVEIFRSRFGRAPISDDYASRRLPRLGR